MFDLVFESSCLGLRGLLYASSGAVVLPAVVRTANPFFIDATERERRTAMRAPFADDTVASLPVAVDHKIFTQEAKCFDRLLIGELASACDRHPVAPQHFSPRLAAPDLRDHLVFFACKHGVLPFLGRRSRCAPRAS